MDEKCGEVHKMLSKYFQFFLDENRLELNERFTLTDTVGNPMFIGCEFWFNKQNGGKLVCDNENLTTTDIVISIFRGNTLVKKLPYKPQIGDTYYFVNSCGDVDEEIFDGDVFDYLIRNAEKCYRTRAEAELNAKQDLKDLRGDE